MKITDLSGIDLGQIQTFTAVAGTKSFTKAAELMHTSQPVVSKRIAALENTLGMVLFVRRKHEAKLTPAGRMLYNACNDMLQQFLEAVNKANSFQTGFTKHLTIGYCASSYPYHVGGYFSREHPDIDLYYIKMQYPTMLEKLLSGGVDVVFYGSFGQHDFMRPPFKCKVFGKFPLTACVLRSNPLAQKAEIEVSDLRSQDFVMLSPLVAPMWLGFVTDLCIQERFTPRVAAYVDDVLSLPMNLRTNHSVFITDPYCTVEAKNFDIVYLPIKDIHIGSAVAWNGENENELILAMVEASRRFWADTAPDC